jgi:hypothetical protein
LWPAPARLDKIRQNRHAIGYAPQLDGARGVTRQGPLFSRLG